MASADQPTKPRKLFAWAGPLIIVASLGAMSAALIFNAIDPRIDGVLLSGTAFFVLFVSSFWMHTYCMLVLGLVCSIFFNGRLWCGIGTVPVVVIGALMVPGGSIRLPPESPGPRITVFSANLMYGRGDGQSLLKQIDEVDPDVVVLQEYTDGFAAQWESELLRRYPHSDRLPSDGAFGQATFSRLAFVETPRRYPRTEISPSRGWPAQTEVVVRVGEREVSVVNVHLLPPTGFTMVMDQHRMATGLQDVFGNVDRPTVLAGDFNSNERGLPVRRLLDVGFHRARLSRATWPRTGVFRHVPGIRLDHVLYRGTHVSVLEKGVGADFGSDHRPVWATLLVEP